MPQFIRSCAVLPALVFCTLVQAQGPCERTLGWAVDQVFVRHQRFLSLHDAGLTFGQFACGQVCAVNALEAIRSARGLPALDTLALVNMMNQENPEYRAGLNATEFTKVMTDLLARFGPPGVDFQFFALKYTSRPTPHGPFAIDHFERGDLTPDARILRILSYAAFTESGEPIGAHVVAVLGHQGEDLIIWDPNVPDRTLRMKLGKVSWYDEPQTLRLIPEEPEFVKPAYGTRPLILIGVATLRL